jgi:hypothetical protein
VVTHKICWQESLDDIHHEIKEDAGEDDPADGGNLEHGPIGRAVVRAPRKRGGFGSAAGCFKDATGQKSKKQAGNTSDVKGHSPAVIRCDIAAEEESKETTYGKAKHEKGDCASAARGGVKVADEGVCSGSASGFADADAKTRDEKRGVIPSETGCGGEDAPDGNSNAKDERTIGAIGEASERDADDRVEESEGGSEPADLGIGERPLMANGFDEGAEDLAVVKIEKVDSEEDDKGVAGGLRGWIEADAVLVGHDEGRKNTTI